MHARQNTQSDIGNLLRDCHGANFRVYLTHTRRGEFRFPGPVADDLLHVRDTVKNRPRQIRRLNHIPVDDIYGSQSEQSQVLDNLVPQSSRSHDHNVQPGKSSAAVDGRVETAVVSRAVDGDRIECRNSHSFTPSQAIERPGSESIDGGYWDGCRVLSPLP